MSHNGGSDKSERVGERLIAALLSQPTQADAAASVGISLATVRRYLKRPKFLQRYREARRKVVEVAVARLQVHTEKAVKTLAEALDAPKVADRIRAADLILANACKADEAATNERLEELEAIVAILREQAEKRESDDEV